MWLWPSPSPLLCEMEVLGINMISLRLNVRHRLRSALEHSSLGRALGSPGSGGMRLELGSDAAITAGTGGK